ncbi:MAG TPA: FAD-dependent oxidoreductase [Allosphingosinicella sp.]|jgi:hypothetical protein
MGIYHDQVIEAAYLHTKPGCFYIGPFARRVSFASQQYRALDLVAALAHKNKLVHPKGHRRANKPKQVAVIGAGIAGLTAAAALRGQGCRVHLYERKDEPLMLQKNARHRLIHPTISRWPDSKPELTTTFPFLDWFAAPCDQVISAMRREWKERLCPARGDRNFEFRPKVKITGLKSEHGAVTLMMDAGCCGRDIPEYDYAFVTTGYGDEEGTEDKNAISYWTEDEIDIWREERRQVYISGCGDGGLIDALRLVHADFDRGWLAIRLAHLLTERMPTSVLEEISDAENQALMAAKSLACMNLTVSGDEGAIDAPLRKVGARFENDAIVRGLTQFYRDLVPKLPYEARNLLDVSLRKANVANGRVVLVSRQEEPFGPYAAPIHKIMVQHARWRNRITYSKGELSLADGNKTIRLISDRRSIEVTEEMGLVVRHGSHANLSGLAFDAESESLKIRQFMLADYIDTESRPQLPPPPGYPDEVSERSRYIGARREMVQELVETLEPGATVTATGQKYFYESPLVAPPDRKAVGIDVPEKVFGIDIVRAEMLEVEAL